MMTTFELGMTAVVLSLVVLQILHAIAWFCIPLFFWKWFMMPMFHLPDFAFGFAVMVALLWGVIMKATAEPKSREVKTAATPEKPVTVKDVVQTFKKKAPSIALPFVVVGIGWLVHLFLK